MYNIAYVKVTKNSTFLLKINNYLLKSYVFNTKYTSSNAKLLFKTSLCKFAHDRKTLIKIKFYNPNKKH